MTNAPRLTRPRTMRFPSPYSLSQFTSPTSDLSGADYPRPYTGGRWKVLMIGADERYLLTDNGTMFSTGNHPVETLLPMYHLDKAGFAFDVATLSGNPVKFEFWAMPSEDAEVRACTPAIAMPSNNRSNSRMSSSVHWALTRTTSVCSSPVATAR